MDKYQITDGVNIINVAYQKGKLMSIGIIIFKNSVRMRELLNYIPLEKPEGLYELMQGNFVMKKIEKEVKDSEYNDYVEEWFAFYKQRVGVNPKFDGVQGKALKTIIQYLKSETGENAMVTFQYMLNNWNKLDAFTQSKTNLMYINSHISEILTQLKHGKRGEKQAANLAEKYRAKL